MSKGLYRKLALTNIRQHAKTYYPFILASSATIMMFYNMMYLLMSREVNGMHESATLGMVLGLGGIVTGFFSVILLLYINSFLIKRRKKEFGLFNILGMEKKHIARMMLIETAIIAFLCLVLGLAAGVLFSKLALLLLLKILSVDAAFGFEIPLPAVGITAILFGSAFMINLIYNVFQVHVSKPVELLKGGNVGEKEPRTKWLLALIGFASLGGGYCIALTVESPLSALNMFFVAVILVIIGTYCLFTAGSIAILKALRRNKRFYYRTNPFIAVSGMIYRMKQNAAGLASICVLSTMVIVMLSSTVSLYIGLEDVLRTRYLREISVEAGNLSAAEARSLEEATNKALEQAGIVPQNPISLRYISEPAIQNGDAFEIAKQGNYSNKAATLLTFIPVEEYNRIEGVSAELMEGEALIYVEKGQIRGDVLDFDGFPLTIAGRVDSLDSLGEINVQKLLTNSYVIITSNDQDILRARMSMYGDRAIAAGLDYSYSFDTHADKETQIKLVSSLSESVKLYSGRAEGRESVKQTFLMVYGSLFFIGLFLGSLFILGTVLIIYYKQISEGYDDKERFAIMSKVGLDRQEIKRTIRYQVLSVFFLPLLMAVCHIAAAFPVISKLLAIFNMTNVPLYALCTAATILVFGLCYALIYTLTARTYYKIVRS